MSADVKSIADLRIVVDANTETFSKGITDSRAMISQFVGEGSGALSAFDASFGRLGLAATAMQGRLGGALSLMATSMANLNPAMATLVNLAGKLGMSDEVSKLTGAFSELGSELLSVANVSIESAVGKMKAYSGALGDAGTKSNEFKEKAQEVSKPLLQQATDATEYIARTLKAANAGMDALTQEQLQGLIKFNEQLLQNHKKQLTELQASPQQAGSSFLSELFGGILGNKSEADQAAETIAHLTAHLEKLRAAMMAKVDGNWTAEINFADVAKYLESLQRQTEEMRLQNETLGMSKARAAEYLAIRKAELEVERENRAKGSDLAISGEDRARIEQRAAGLRELTKVREDHNEALRKQQETKRMIAQQERGIEKLDETIARDTEALEQKKMALMFGAEQTESYAYAQKLLAQARRDGIDLTDDEVSGIYAAAEAYSGLKREVRALEDAQKRLQEVSNVVGNAILNEFTAWTRGGEFNVKRMVANMLAEMAKLVLQRNVLDALFGGSSGSGGGMFGNFLGSIFGGARALGGPVESGRAYLVGERGPELFAPGLSGSILSNGNLGKMLQPQATAPSRVINAPVTLSIDARGATVDAVEKLNELKAQLPTIIMQTIGEAQERGMA